MRARLFSSATVLMLSIITEHAAYGQLGGFTCPLKGDVRVRKADSVARSGGRFNSDRGNGKTHSALDLNSTFDQPVLAALNGRAAVAQAGWGQMGNTVIIDHGAGAYTIYGHLNKITISEGRTVQAGEQIGTVGYSGNALALKNAGLPPHLHFALVQAGETGLADKDRPLRKMKEWGDHWQSLGADLAGPVDPVLFMGSLDCWKGSTTVGAPEEK